MKDGFGWLGISKKSDCKSGRFEELYTMAAQLQPDPGQTTIEITMADVDRMALARSYFCYICIFS